MENPSNEAGDQYNLKWNNHLANFVQTFIEHQQGETLVDVTLSCEGQYIKTHKLILSACSDYFHSIFQVHSTLQHPIIFLNNVRFSDLKSILHFMYHGEVKVLDKDLPQVLQLGETLQIKGLSSVKLRDVPPENTTPIQMTNKKSQKIIRNSHLANASSSKLSAAPQKIVLNEVSHVGPGSASPIDPIKSEVRPRYDFSKSRNIKIVTPSQLNSSSFIPVNAHVTIPTSIISTPKETVAAPAPVLPETPPKSTSSRMEELPYPSANSELRNPASKPPHAFMIFASEWRKKLTVEHPEENNKEISVRLGNLWKNLLPEDKNRYYTEAKKAEEEYKIKYPYLSPNDSLKRKADVLQDTTNSTSPRVVIDPMEVVQIQEQVDITDSD